MDNQSKITKKQTKLLKKLKYKGYKPLEELTVKEASDAISKIFECRDNKTYPLRIPKTRKAKSMNSIIRDNPNATNFQLRKLLNKKLRRNTKVSPF